MLHPLYVPQGRQHSAPCIRKQIYFTYFILLFRVQYLAVAHDNTGLWYGCWDMVVSRTAMCSIWGHLCIHSCSYSQSGVCLNWLGQVHPRSVAYQTTEWHQRWMCHVFLAATLQHSSLSSWSSSHLHGTPELPDLENSLSVRAYHTFQVKGWCFGLICFINHGALRSRNESELILEKTKLYLGIALCRQCC